MDEAALVWRWEAGETRRYAVESAVTAPIIVWFYASRNWEARVLAWQVRAVVACTAEPYDSKRMLDITCRIEDVSLMALAMGGDQTDTRRPGPLVQILPELDQRLTGAEIDLLMRRDGRIVDFSLRGLPTTLRRESVMAENARVILERAFVGFDLPLPRGGSSEGGVWGHHRNELFHAPTLVGTVGSADFVCQAVPAADGTVQIVSEGRGMSQIGDDGATLSMEHRGDAVFDLTGGDLLEAHWTVSGIPTAGSLGNLGTRAPEYHQYGRILRLAPDQAYDVGETMEITGEVASMLVVPSDPGIYANPLRPGPPR